MTAGVARAPAPIEVDHLVVACRSLDQGRTWCEATFGVAPEPGGRHPMMATHNLLLALASVRFPRSYLELIAIDPDAPAPARPRWFDLDCAAMQAAIAITPRLVHWGARTGAIDAAVATLRGLGVDPGPVAGAERMTPRGLLRWRITLPADGGRRGAGAVPLLIEWGDMHPTDTLAPSGVELESLQLGAVDAAVATALGVAASGRVDAPLTAVLNSPRGRVTLTAPLRQSPERRSS